MHWAWHYTGTEDFFSSPKMGKVKGKVSTTGLLLQLHKAQPGAYQHPVFTYDLSTEQESVQYFAEALLTGKIRPS